MKKVLALAAGGAMLLATPAFAGGLLWDNGMPNGVNGNRPTANWDPLGMMDNFEVGPGGWNISGFRAWMIDGTNPNGVSIMNQMRIQIFQNVNNDMSTMVYNDLTAVLDVTYSGGTLSVTDTGNDLFSRDVDLFEGTGGGFLAEGLYGVMVSFPTFGALDSFIASSDGGGANPEAIRVFGPDLNGVGAFNDMAFQFLGTPAPAPGALALLGLAGLASRRRRRA